MDQSPLESDNESIKNEINRPSLDPIPACNLPDPDALQETKDLPRHPPKSEPTPKGFFGAIVRTVQKVPPCVWVVNRHSEEITVVVSQYKPTRIITGAEVNASVTGAGLSFSTTMFVGPASKKSLTAPDQDREGSMAVFPLWTRKEGFGVISIFKGPEKALYIENDRIPLGATVYFANKPDLRVVKYDGKLLHAGN